MKIIVPLVVWAYAFAGSCGPGKELSPITLSKGPCKGTCPVYTVTFFADGMMRFEGKDYAQYQGKTSKKLTAEEIKNIKNSFIAIPLSELKESYDEVIYDIPETTLLYEDKKTVFKRSQSVPEKLSAFVQTIETLLRKKKLL